jgi:hypothetical protein
VVEEEIEDESKLSTSLINYRSGLALVLLQGWNAICLIAFQSERKEASILFLELFKMKCPRWSTLNHHLKLTVKMPYSAI